MKPFNPTGGGLRNDGWGQGHFGAVRSTGSQQRTHLGKDYLGKPGAYVASPSHGIVEGTGKPYGDGKPWDCYLKIKDGETVWRLFYVQPLPGVIGQHVFPGQVIGVLEDVSEKYGEHPTKGRMLPHCHLERIVNGTKVDPEI